MLRNHRWQPTILVGLFLALWAFASPLQAQYRNQGLQVPLIGWMGFDSSLGALNGSCILNPTANQAQTGWCTTDHLSLGVGHMRAVGYQLWWDSQAVLGFGQPTIQSINKNIIALNMSSGLRYTFLDERHRPFVSAHIHYLQ